MTQTSTATSDPRLYVRITNDLRHKISTGAITASTRLSALAIAQEWHVHKGTVRKAMRTLEADGLLKHYNGLGYYVLPPTQQPDPPHPS